MDQHPGMTTPSDTYDAHSEGTNWPTDRFTRMVMDSTLTGTGAMGIDTPAAHSYANDANMEAFDALSPYAMPGDMTDPARYTGAIS